MIEANKGRRWTAAKEFQARVRQVDVVNPLTVRFALKEPWPDFMMLYGTTASAAGPRRAAQVRHAGRRRGFPAASHRRPSLQVREPQAGGGGRARGVRRVQAPRPARQALVMKSVPDVATRAAMLRTGEADIAYALDGQDAEVIRRDPKMKLVASRPASCTWLEFAEQCDPKFAVERPPAAAGGEPRARPQGHQRGGVPGLLSAGRRHRPARDGLRAAGRARSIRAGEGQ